MQRDRSTRRLVVVYGGLVALSLILLAASASTPVQELRHAVNFALAPVQGALSGGTRSLTSIFSAIGELDQLRQRNASLTGQVEQLQGEVSQLQALKSENERLSSLLGLRGALGYATTPAAVTKRQTNEFERVVTLDRGTEDGVAIGDPVLADGGALAGVVTDAGRNYATVTLISDTRSVVIGLVQSSRATGEVDGRLAGPLAMSNIPSTEQVAVDDTVVTAGLDIGDVRSAFPKGLLIGRVVQVQADAAAIVQTAFIQPAADLDNLEYVLVITDFTPPQISSPAPSPGRGAPASPSR